MQLPATALLVATLVVAAGVAAVTPVRAETPLSDVAYMEAARCAGLADGARMDVHRVDALLNSQATGRVGDVLDKSDELRSDAARRMRQASGYEKAQISSEIAGTCRPYLGEGVARSAVPGAPTAR